MYKKYVTDQIDVHYAQVLKHGLDQEVLDLSHSPEYRATESQPILLQPALWPWLSKPAGMIYTAYIFFNPTFKYIPSSTSPSLLSKYKEF